MNQNAYIQQLILEELERQRRQEQEGNSPDKLRGYLSKLQNTSEGMSAAGDYLSGKDSQWAQNIGSYLNKAGNGLSNVSGNVSSVLNAPQNYFKGYANRALEQGMQNLEQSIAGETGAMGTIGDTLTNSALANTAGTAGAEAAGTAAGSAAGGAMAAGPIGALAALGMMALQGTNRKRAEQSGEQLMNATKQKQENNLNQAMQSTQQLANQQYGLNSSIGDYGLNDGAMTGGASGIKNKGIVDSILSKFILDREKIKPDYYAENMGLSPLNNTADTYSGNTGTLGDYQNYLRGQGYSDNVVNGVSQGLNSGVPEIADWITQYNKSGEGQVNPIGIPVTEEEIASAREGNFNSPTFGRKAVKTGKAADTGFLSNIANVLGNIGAGYQENKNNGFSRSNLTDNQFKETYTTKGEDGEDITGEKTYDKGVSGRIGEALGTVSRWASNPNIQALVAGGLGAGLTGNPLYGLGLGYKVGGQKALSDMYQQALKKNGIDTDLSMLGNITSSDMNAMMTPTYKEMQNKYYDDKLNEYKEYHEWQKQLQEAELERKLEQMKQNRENEKFDQGIKTRQENRADKKLDAELNKPDINKDPEFLEDYQKFMKIRQGADDPKSGYTDEMVSTARQEILRLYGGKYGIEKIEKLLKGS